MSRLKNLLKCIVPNHLQKVKQREYHDQNKKDAAYGKLILKVCEMDPDASKKSVLKEINNLFYTYKKVLTTKSGSGSEDICEPKL